MMGRGELMAALLLVLFAALVLLLSCSGRVHDLPSDRPETVLGAGAWCVVANVHGYKLIACTDDVEFCRRSQRQVREHGRLVGVRSVSACLWVAGE